MVYNPSNVPATATVEVKSKYTSKTNITAALLLIFSVLGMIGKLPAGFEASTGAEAVVGAGAVLVMFFRTISRAVLR